MIINKKDIEIVKDVIPFLEFPVFFITTILFFVFSITNFNFFFCLDIFTFVIYRKKYW